jgi:hypothetical protein
MKPQTTFVYLDSTTIHAVPHALGPSPDDIADHMEVISNGIEAGGSSFQLSDGGLIYLLLFFVILIVLSHKPKSQRRATTKNYGG